MLCCWGDSDLLIWKYNLRNVSQVGANWAPGDEGERKVMHHLRVFASTQLQSSRHQQNALRGDCCECIHGVRRCDCPCSVLCLPTGCCSRENRAVTTAKSFHQCHQRIKVTHSWWCVDTSSFPDPPVQKDREDTPRRHGRKLYLCLFERHKGVQVLGQMPQAARWAVHFCYATKALLCNRSPAVPCCIRLLWGMKNIVIFNSWINTQWT